MSSSTDSKNKWVVVSLSTVGERETNVKVIKNAVCSVLKKDLPVFIPAVSKKARNESHTLFYMDGYVFVKYEAGVPYMNLQDTTYFNHVLNSGGRYSLVCDDVLDPLKDKVKDLGICKFKIGDKVCVVKGEFKNLQGEIRTIYDGDETVQIDASQRSKPMLIDFPVIYIRKMSND